MLTKVALNCSKFSELLPRAARSHNNTNMFTTILLWLFTRVWATIPVITLPGLLHGRASTGMQRKNVCTTLCLHLQALSTCKVSDSRDFELYWFIPFQTTHFWWQQQRTQTASDKINKSKGMAFMCFKTMILLKCIGKHSVISSKQQRQKSCPDRGQGWLSCLYSRYQIALVDRHHGF